MERGDQLARRLSELRESQPQATSLDALLDLSRLNFEPGEFNPENPETFEWGIRKKPGWLVPLPVGYAALSPLHGAGEVENARDDSTPFRFVESLYSLGEWVSPHRMTNLNQLLWHSTADTEKGLYRCVNRHPETLETATDGIIA